MKKSLAIVASVFAASLMITSVSCSKSKSSGSNGSGEAAEEKRPDPNPATDFSYDLTKDGKGIVINKYKGENKTTIVIPDTIENIPVVEIGSEAFKNVKTGASGEKWYNDVFSFHKYEWLDIPNSVEYLYVPPTVTSVGNGAFSFYGKHKNEAGKEVIYSIKKLDIDLSKLEYVGDSAFAHCSFVNTDIVYKKSWGESKTADAIYGRGYAESQFEDTNVTSVEIEDGADQVLGSAFYMCNDLKSVKIPASVKRFREYAFSGCEAEITVADGCKAVCDRGPDEVFSTNLLNLASKQAVRNFGSCSYEPKSYW